MSILEMEIRMMEMEINMPEVTAEFPVKGNRRETRRVSDAEHIRKRYGNVRGEEGKPRKAARLQAVR